MHNSETNHVCPGCGKEKSYNALRCRRCYGLEYASHAPQFDRNLEIYRRIRTQRAPVRAVALEYQISRQRVHVIVQQVQRLLDAGRATL